MLRILCYFLLCLLPACGTVGGSVASRSSNQLELSSLNSYGIVDYPEGKRYLNDLMGKILATEPAAKDMAVTVEIVGDPGLQARANEARKVYVHWRVLRDIQNESALAALLGHEVAHILLKHDERASRAQWLAPGIKIAELLARRTKLGSPALLVAGQYVDKVVVASWSRSMEYEADKMGLQMVSRAGFSPFSFLDFFEFLDGGDLPVDNSLNIKIKDTADGKTTQIIVDLSDLHFGRKQLSHPSFAERREVLRADLQKFSRTPQPSVTSTPGSLTLEELRSRENFKAVMRGLEDANAVLSTPRSPDSAKLALRALNSPVFSSAVVQMAAVSALPPSEWSRYGITSIETLARNQDAPLVLPVNLMTQGLERANLSLAVEMADLIKSRYEIPPDLFPILINVYEQAFQSLVAQEGRMSQMTPVQLSKYRNDRLRFSNTVFFLGNQCLWIAKSWKIALNCKQAK